ncbi:MAG: TolC family protein [Flavobacteriaceae bacterium]|nr:TolC family protein [Flavobacteriaceae bacterium]MDZ4146956.1 TolC family protein [Flavobacteriaceae bacterium]
MKKRYQFIIILCLLSLRGFSQEKREFSLEEAIAYAIENNYAAMGANMDVKAAIQKKWETTASGLPQISGSVDYRNNLKQQVTLFDVNGDGIDEPFTFGTKQTMTVFGTLDQIVFDGSYLVGLQSAKTFLDISKQSQEKTELDVRKNVIQAYGNVLLTDENIKILENNKKSVAQTLNDTQAMFEQGLAEEESVEQLQITLSTLENSLNRTRRLQDIAYKMFNLTLGLEIETPVTLTDNLDALTVQDLMYDMADEPFDLENNIDFKIAKTNTRSQELLLKLEKSRALPTLNASLNGGTTANSDSFTFLSSGNGQRWFASSLFSLSLKVPLFSSLERSAKTKQARIALMQAQTQEKETEQRIRLNYESAKTDFQFSVESFQTNKKNLNLAERIEHKNQIKFKEGIASSFELAEAQRQLYTAQQNYLQAMIDVINKKAELETILNKL